MIQIQLKASGNELIANYSPEPYTTTTAVSEVFDSEKPSVNGVGSREFRIRKTFHFQKRDLRSFDEFECTFVLAHSYSEEYWEIPARVLCTKHPVLITRDFRWEPKHFVTVNNVSIFGALDGVISQQIIIGGEAENAIPLEVFLEMVNRFPTRVTLQHYTRKFIQSVVGEYVNLNRNYSEEYSKHLERKRRLAAKNGNSQKAQGFDVDDLELVKFKAVREYLAARLNSEEALSESEWQTRILPVVRVLFPRYVAVMEKVKIPDSISGKENGREIDLLLVDSDGSVDVLELKVPGVKLLRKTRYRDNYVPVSDLNGTVVQAEKYLFHLQRGGVRLEKKLQGLLEKHFPDLVANGLEIKITKPKALILAGRTDGFGHEQKRDFEFYRRSLGNVVELISYDELVHRIDNIIVSLEE